MPRIALEIAYDGAEFLGWQSQPHGKGVQDAVEAALKSLGEDGRVTGAGRTDAGVHAKAQVAHFDARKDWRPRKLTLAINAFIHPSVSIIRSNSAEIDFHARRSAKSREYRYFIWNSPTCYPHLKPHVLWLTGSHYDWRRATAAAPLLVGRHDFRAFCRTGDCPPDSVRNVKKARITRRGRLIVFRIVADSYLTNMVRIAVGNLLDIAAGKRGENWLSGLLDGKSDRQDSSRTAPPNGLFLWKVNYENDIWADL
jgi:tRNA pseudouridine38-40 synthase